jgi:Na+/proline symporter
MTRFETTINKLFHFYYDGFTSMSWWGRRAWLIIIIKLAIIFIILKLFFFPDFLRTKFDSDDERSNYVIEQLTGNR